MNKATKRILTILIGALILAGIILLLWLWYINKQQQQQTAQENSSAASSAGAGTNASVPVSPSQNTGGYTSQAAVSPNPTGSSGNQTTASGQSSGSAGNQNSGGVSDIAGAGSGGGTDNAASSGDTYNAQTGTYTIGNGTETYNPETGTYTPTEATGTSSPATPSSPSTPTTPGTTNPPAGATFIPDNGTPFSPTAINGIAASNPTGSGNIFNPSTSASSVSGDNSVTGLLLAGVGVSLAACSLNVGTAAGGIQSALTGLGLIQSAASKGNAPSTGDAGKAASGGGAPTSIPSTGIPSVDDALQGLASTGNLPPATGFVASAGTAAAGVAAVPTNDAAANLQLGTLNGTLGKLTTNTVLTNTSNTTRDDFMSCITRGIARLALQQITASTVNWINSGFNGSPTFIQNYQGFFANVANQAAGTYIQSSGLSFLCSPFALQVKIAVAQSYAQQTSAAPSCSLTQVSNNITNFINGDFTAGGWPALLSFTTVPTNNPFGAFLYGQVGLQTAVSNAQQNANQNISPEGFLNMQQISCPTGNINYQGAAGAGTQTICINNSPTSNDTKPTVNGQCPSGYSPVLSTSNTSKQIGGGVVTSSANNGTICPLTAAQTAQGCTCKITTPGSIIATSLDNQLKLPTDELNMSKDWDEIVSSLMTQLLTKGLQGGISNLSGQNGYQSGFVTPDQQQAGTLAQTLLTQMQSDTSVAQQYGNVLQSNISAIQGAQSQLQTLSNCWASAASSTTLSADQQSTASGNATAAQAQIASLQMQVDSYNNQITGVNGTIALLQQLQTQVLNASALADVQNVQNSYTNAQQNGSIITTDNLSTEQTNSTTLQSQMASVNQNTSAQLTQCYAFGNQTNQ